MKNSNPLVRLPQGCTSRDHAAMQVTRYHGARVALHWLLALMLLGMLGYGTWGLSRIPNASPEKIDALRGHMIGGGLILTLMLARLVLRLKTTHPPAASSGNAMLDRLAPATSPPRSITSSFAATGCSRAWVSAAVDR